VTDAENEVTAELIAELLREQHPDLADLADLPLTFGARGWDNQLWRLGDDLAVRLPWATQDAGELLLKEHALLPAMAPRLPLRVPVPQRLGRPSERFPRPWIVTTWVDGEPADRALPLAVPRRPTRWRLSWRPCISRRPTTRLPAGTEEVVRWPTPAKASHISWRRRPVVG
jgi:aminoglycoside phosphotransferase (APT) family kinase protein